MEPNEKKFFSNANDDGRIYPDTVSVQQVQWLDEEWFQVIDETGWNGFEACKPIEVALIRGENAAIAFAMQYVRFSDTEDTFKAAVALLNKEQGAWMQLKEAVDWRDRR